jgi:hypothetical protein
MAFCDESVGKTPDPIELTKKDHKKKEKNRKRKTNKKKEEQAAPNMLWKKKIFFFRLPYWKDNLLRHNLDVIHVGKNEMDNILGTMLDIKGKNKDNTQAHHDLQEMGLRPKLHPYTGDDGKTYLLPACHMMSNNDKTAFLEVLQDVRVPGDYASNIS